MNQKKIINNKELEDSKKELIEIKEKLNKLELGNNTTINNNNNTFNNNIVVNNYGQEDIFYITKDQLKQYALNIPDGINQLTEESFQSTTSRK